jgi:hypothetical protein
MSASAAEVGRHVICTDGWRVTMHVELRRGHYKGQIVSARDPPTRCQQQCSLVVPQYARHDIWPNPSAKSPQKRPTKRPERERLTMRRRFDSRPTSGRSEVDEQEMLSYQCQSPMLVTSSTG